MNDNSMEITFSTVFRLFYNKHTALLNFWLIHFSCDNLLKSKYNLPRATVLKSFPTLSDVMFKYILFLYQWRIWKFYEDLFSFKLLPFMQKKKITPDVSHVQNLCPNILCWNLLIRTTVTYVFTDNRLVVTYN